MKNNLKYWNDIYKAIINKKPDYDLWLDDYDYILKSSSDNVILDLGCGSGGDTLYLHERNYKVISCDYSDEALEIVKKYIPNSNPLKLDITKKLPFKDNSFKLVIADLSLHYFNSKTTRSIILELKRILTSHGYLLLRLNSILDTNYGALEGIEIEKHYYYCKTGYKRFFDEKDIMEFFYTWDILKIKERSIIRYGNKKILYEVLVKNKEDKNG